jgi:hypothetical protein
VVAEHRLRNHGMAGQHGPAAGRRVGELALKGAFADLSRGFFRVMGLVKTTVLLGFALAASGGPIRPGDPPTEWPPATFMDTGRSLSGTPQRQRGVQRTR